MTPLSFCSCFCAVLFHLVYIPYGLAMHLPHAGQEMSTGDFVKFLLFFRVCFVVRNFSPSELVLSSPHLNHIGHVFSTFFRLCKLFRAESIKRF